MSVVSSHGEIGRQLSEILGIPKLVDATIHFPLDGCISADVKFYVSEVQAKAILQLCKDGKWRSPPNVQQQAKEANKELIRLKSEGL